MRRFTAREVLPGVFHIRDSMGVYMTLLAGHERALLVDTGYGLDDVSSYVKTLTDKPVIVLLTHAHHDHALGARWFQETFMFPQDLPAFSVYTGEDQRRVVMMQAKSKDLEVPEDYLNAPIPVPKPLEEGAIDLGGLTARIILCPGHTPGSAVVYIPERDLLLSGDDWNPCTWLFFPEALAAQDYRQNMRALLDLPFAHMLCSHREALYPRSDLEMFCAALTDDVLRTAQRVNMGWEIDTREVFPTPGHQFVFDFGKTALSGREDYI